MIDMHSALRRLALASTQDEIDATRMEAVDVLDQAGWETSARSVMESIGRPIPPDSHARPAMRP